ncbi:unnamed protein product, partial [Scytosiphon promiscuus]
MEAQAKFKGLQKIAPKDLTVGMYVAQLDVDWKETSYAVQGFYIRNQSTILKLSDKHAYVYVDPRRYDSKLGDVKLRAVTKGSQSTR